MIVGVGVGVWGLIIIIGLVEKEVCCEFFVFVVGKVGLNSLVGIEVEVS